MLLKFQNSILKLSVHKQKRVKITIEKRLIKMTFFKCNLIRCKHLFKTWFIPFGDVLTIQLFSRVIECSFKTV